MEARCYADNLTDSMAKAISETERRRSIQQAYNEKHGIVPTAAGKKASNSILFLELSRKLKTDGLMPIWCRWLAMRLRLLRMMPMAWPWMPCRSSSISWN